VRPVLPSGNGTPPPKSGSQYSAAKQIRESAFGNRKTLTQQVLKNQKDRVDSVYSWTKNPTNRVTKALSPAAKLARFVLAPEGMSGAGLSSLADPLVKLMDPEEKAEFKNSASMNVGEGLIGSTSSRAGRKVLGDLIDEAEGRAGKAASGSKKKIGVTTQYLRDAAERGIIDGDFLKNMEHAGTPLFDRVRRAAERADLIDTPVYNSVDEAPKRGTVIINNGEESVARVGNKPISLGGRLLGAEFPGTADINKVGQVSPSVLKQNVITTLERGDELFGDLVGTDKLHPMRERFYQQVFDGFLDPLSRASGVNADELAQIGASFSPSKKVPMEMAQTIATAMGLGPKQLSSANFNPEALTAVLRKLGLGQMADQHPAQYAKHVGNPRHLYMTAQDAIKTGVYSLNKAKPMQESLSDAQRLAAYTIDTWQRRGLGFAKPQLAEAGNYGKLLRPITEGLDEAAPIIERQLARMGYGADEAARLARIPNIAQSIMWHDIRNGLGDVLGRALK